MRAREGKRGRERMEQPERNFASKCSPGSGMPLACLQGSGHYLSWPLPGPCPQYHRLQEATPTSLLLPSAFCSHWSPYLECSFFFLIEVKVIYYKIKHFKVNNSVAF